MPKTCKIESDGIDVFVVFKGATMGFDLPEGTRLEEAKELAQHMRKITHLSRTERSEGQIGGHPSGLTTQRH